MNTKNLVRYIDYAKFAIAGAIGGLAFINTAYQIIGISTTQSVESIAMACGAALLTAAVKVLHVV